MADDREHGFITIQRRVRSSRLFRSLSGEQRSVFFTLLLLANWKEDAVINGGQWHPIRRGELAHSLATIADEAGVSIKVVRTTIAKLAADDSAAGGRGPFLKERWTGTATGTGLRVLTIQNYSEYQAVATNTGTPSGTAGARQGHDAGTAGAPREQDQQGEQGEEVLPARFALQVPVAVAKKPSRPKSPPDPRHKPTVELFVRLFKELRGGDYRVNGAADGSAVKKLLTWAEATDVEIERRMRAAFADPFFRNKRPTLAYFVSGWNGWQGAAVAPSPTATGTRYVPGENLYPDE